jgi:hypothetical protein
VGRHGLQGRRGGERHAELGLGAEPGPVELGQVMGELVHMRAEGEQVGVAQGAVVGRHGADSPGGLRGGSQEVINEL